MKYWLIIIALFVSSLTGCESKTFQTDRTSNNADNSEQKTINTELEKKYLDTLKGNTNNIQVVRTIKLYFDNDNEQDLVVLYNDIEKNSRSNIAIANSRGISAIDLASSDHDYVFTNPENTQIIQRESRSNEVIVPLYNQRLNHVVNFHITMEVTGNNTQVFKIKSELSKQAK